MDTNFLNASSVLKFTNPWEHHVVDNFLPSTLLKKVQTKLCSINEGFLKRENDSVDLNFMFLPDLTLAKFFLSNSFQAFIEKATNTKLDVYEKGLVQLRKMTPDSPYFPPHIDNQDERSLVCLFYLSPDWDQSKGGELVLHESEYPTDFDKKIEPCANRLVFFFSDEVNWHSVNRVHNWNRYTIISEWIVTEERSL